MERRTQFGIGAIGLGAGLVLGLERACAPSENEDGGKKEIIEAREAQRSAQAGDWQLESTAIAPIVVDGHTYRTFYNFLHDTFEKEAWFSPLPETDEQAYIDGYITLTRELNPGVALDNWQALDGQRVQFPVNVTASPSPREVLRPKSGDSYRRLQDLAEADGFPVRDTKSQQRTFDQAFLVAQPLPASPFYYRDEYGSEDSPARLEVDVIQGLQNMGKDFSEMEFDGKKGWRLCLTDLMRDPKAQASRKSIAGSTHTTGRTFDLSDGRFIHPDGSVVTWSTFVDGKAKGPSAYAEIIEREMRPALEKLALAHGFLPFVESGHWHAYAPKTRIIDLRRLIAEKAAKREVEKKGARVMLPTERSPMHTALLRVLEREAVDGAAERTPSATAHARILEGTIENLESRNLKRPFLTGLSFDALERQDRDYAHMSDEEVASALSRLPKKRAEKILKGRVKEDLIRTIQRMPPEDVIRLNMFEGMTIHHPRKFPFHDLQGVWNWKILTRRVSSPEVRTYGPLARKHLRGKDRSVTMLQWLTQQEQAANVFARHSNELGYDAEMTRYITPEVMLSVIHAEFFSELDSQAFVGLTPQLFETYNIAYGPAVNDHYFSGGLVQMTAGTFTDTLNRKAKMLRTIKENDPAAKFIVPSKRGNDYDANEFVDAMLCDLDSQMFFNSLAVADHLRLGFPLLMEDGTFVEAWNAASEEDRYRFMGAFAPLAINGGVGHAETVARHLANKRYTNLRTMAQQLEHLSNKTYAKRGAARGLSTMELLLAGGSKPQSLLAEDR